MIDTPYVTTTEPQLIAAIPMVIPRDKIREVIGPALQELMTTVAAQGIEVTGPWFTHHFRITPDEFDFEICIPVVQPVTPSGRVVPASWPAMMVARTVFHGSYSGLSGAWTQLHAWVKTNDYTPAKDLWEVYVAGPDSGVSPALWRTELNRPLVD